MGQIETRSGRVVGDERRGVHVFRGIPYARPPVGPHRFASPEPEIPWAGVRRSSAFAPVAPQGLSNSRVLRLLSGPFGPGTSEDCLYLNVWTPGPDAARRPVMVWIHGGGFSIGGGSTRFYSGAPLARRGDVVVVTLNYRLGALGFLDLRERGAPVSNLGLRDQIAALEWVRENIAAFGGDPDNVTLFGESAGAMSIGTLLGTPSAQGLFARAILQSGAAHNVASRAQARRVADRFLEELGEGDLTALRSASLERILTAQRRTAMSLASPGSGLPWQPSLDDDLLREPPLDAIEKGLSRGVDVLVGTNRDEWKLFMLGDRSGHRLDESGLRRRLGRVAASIDGTDPALADAAFAAYRHVEHAHDAGSPTERWVAFQTDRLFRYPAVALADRLALHARTYSYLFTWSPPLLHGRVGACHALEIPFVFGTLRDPLLQPMMLASPGAGALAGRTQDAWLAFSRSGRPGHRGLPTWPRYAAAERSTMLLGHDPGVDAGVFDQAHGFWQPRL